jgi:hypothetical protein
MKFKVGDKVRLNAEALTATVSDGRLLFNQSIEQGTISGVVTAIVSRSSSSIYHLDFCTDVNECWLEWDNGLNRVLDGI